MTFGVESSGGQYHLFWSCIVTWFPTGSPRRAAQPCHLELSLVEHCDVHFLTPTLIHVCHPKHQFYLLYLLLPPGNHCLTTPRVFFFFLIQLTFPVLGT